MMLALARSRTSGIARRHARQLCAPATAIDPEELKTLINGGIEKAKFMIANPPTPKTYQPADFEKDLAKGTIDVMKIGQIYQDVKEIESFQMPTIPWDEYDTELAAKGMPGFVKAVKPKWEAFDAEYRSKLSAAKEKFVAEAEVEMKKVFEGPTGVIAQFKQMEKDVQDSKVKILAELESMYSDMEDLDNLTIADILEKNPEWLAAIEEDLKSHNWSPEPPAALLAKVKGETAVEDSSAAPAAKQIE